LVAPGRSPIRALLRGLLPVGSLGVAGALLVTSMVPASAVEFSAPAPVVVSAATAQATAGGMPALAEPGAAEPQSVEVADVAPAAAERGEYTIVAPPPKPAPK